MTRPSEDRLIARYFAPLAGAGGLGLRDDAACLSPSPGSDLVVTADAVVAGVHFFPDDPPDSIARKALGVNVSDLAGKGADPRGFLLALALPAEWTEAWVAAFAAGLGEAARDWRCPLLGGDTVRTPGALTLAVTALGEVPAGRMVRRTRARPGDLVCITGTVGDAALGLALRRGPDRTGATPARAGGRRERSGDTGACADGWSDSLTAEERAYLVDRYLHPRPRIALSRALRDHAAAAMDVSDGLAGDLAKMLRESGATAVIEVERIPLSRAARAALAAAPGLLERLLTGGDDYEILCAVPPERLAAFQADAEELGVALAVIGRVADGSGLPVFRQGGAERRFEAGSFSHF
ncbi:MAG TPA: thiamine-phosphate kinase [Microvirga sp.]|nr:thiamine-phosphate kinase [Microvirga sp.]